MTGKFLSRRRRLFLGGLALLLILAGVTLPLIPRDNSIENMLPPGSGIQRMLSFLHEARFAGQVALSFHRDPEMPPSDFLAAVDRAVEKLDSPWIEQITSRIDLHAAGENMAFFQKNLPALTTETELQTIQSRLEPEAVEQSLQKIYTDLLKPGGSIALPLIQRDPLGIQQDFLARLQQLAASSGYQIEIRNGRLFSEDGNHLLVVLETSAPVTDVSASRQLLDAVHAAVNDLPPGVSVNIVSGHRHAVSNEEVLRRDVRRAVIAASIGFILLFAGCFRDLRAQFIFAVPLASVLLSLHICRWLTGPLSLVVLGFGVVIVGIAVDYGIHLYVAIRRADDSDAARRQVTRPVVLGALTTLGVFAAFFAAQVPGYTQMAVFSIVSILLSLLGALYVLPMLIKTNPSRRPTTAAQTSRPGGGFFTLWILLLVFLLIPFPKLSFDSDLRALDGAERVVWESEENFRAVWGEGAESLALLVIDDKNSETVLNRNDEIFDAIQQQNDSEEFSSFSAVWKSRRHREENLERWKRFWTDERMDALRATFAEKGALYGFKPDAFSPFFEWLEQPPDRPEKPEENRLFDDLHRRFSQSLNGRHQLISFFPDTPVWTERVREAAGSTGLLISRREMDRILSEGTVQTVRRVALFAVGLVVLFTALLMRRAGDVILALIPAVVSVLAVLKVLDITGLPVNIPTLISGIVVIGLSIDYGIFLVFGCRRGTFGDVCTAVTLSTLTSLVGAGVLLLTQHPALYSIGMTLVAGLTAGYVSALCAVPFLSRFVLAGPTEGEAK